MNEKKNGSKEFVELEEERLRESIRLRGNCAGELRRHPECTCGRPRTLFRHGRRWHRLAWCRRCLAATTISAAAASPKAGGHA